MKKLFQTVEFKVTTYICEFLALFFLFYNFFVTQLLIFDFDR